MKADDERFWRHFEARDRAKYPAAWDVHDHMMNRCRRRPLVTPGRVVVALILIVVVIANIT